MELVTPAIAPMGTAVEYPAAGADLAEVGGAVDGPLMVDLIRPAHDRLDRWQMRVLRRPILADLSQGHADRTGRHAEGVRLALAIGDLESLNPRVEPHPRQLQQVHGTVALEWT